MFRLPHFYLFLQALGFHGDDLTAVPYPQCDTPVMFMCMFITQSHVNINIQMFKSYMIDYHVEKLSLFFLGFSDILHPSCHPYWNGKNTIKNKFHFLFMLDKILESL